MTRIAKFTVLFKKMRSAEVMGMITEIFQPEKVPIFRYFVLLCIVQIFRSSYRRCSVKKDLFKILQISQENLFVEVSF